MKLVSYAVAILLITLLVFSTVNAGELSAKLEDQLAQAAPDQLIPVWIKLYRLESVSQLKGRSEAVAQTRAGRHQFVQEHLQQGHQKAQAKLIEHLRGLNKSGSVINLKQYWIANVVTAEVKASELRRLSSRDDIELIYPVIEPRLIAPIELSAPLYDPLIDSIAPNLSYIRADSAAALGYTGAGRLICSFDTGVDGDHPALYSQWKGHDGDSAAAWFDPFANETFPHTFARQSWWGIASFNSSHGTHVLGTILGRDSAETYRTGVAPDAKWISAGVVDIPGTKLLEAFQWAADPDGNPNTITDVPDVINHSWGFSRVTMDCEDIFFEIIDHTEAMGIVNIFAAGNSYSASTIVNPANRALTNTDCFAVGALSDWDTTAQRAIFSSQGPSDCNGAIKPNVMAPGKDISSAVPGDGYKSWQGTSMAAPHVSGLVLLLREKNPNLTSDEVKQAILSSTTWGAEWGTEPNNAYGWGAIDCVKALNSISDNAGDSANLRLYDFQHPSIQPGDTVTGPVVLKNLGGTAYSVNATLTGSDPSLNILNGTLTFGDITTNSTALSVETISVEVSDTVTPGTTLSLNLSITGSNVTQVFPIYFQIGSPPELGVATHNTGTISFSLSNYGALGLGPDALHWDHGVGFTYNLSDNELWEGGIILGTGVEQISSAIHSYIAAPDRDFDPVPDGDMLFLEPGPSANQESISSFSDIHAANPTGIVITQHSFSYEYPNDDFVIIRYLLTNNSGSSISGLRLGLLFDWDIVTFPYNSGGYNPADSTAWMAYSSLGNLSNFRGLKLIQGQLAGVVTDTVGLLALRFNGGDGFSKSEKWSILSAGIPDTNPYAAIRDDLFQMMNFGPFNLANGEIDSITIAILAGNTLADLQAAGEAAMLVPTDLYDDDENPVLPERFTLYQNYPNPFNPITTIEFDLPTPSEYQLSIFNVLGQTVYETSGRARPGIVRIKWDGGDQPSGIYFYRVSTDQFSASRKMILMK